MEPFHYKKKSSPRSDWMEWSDKSSLPTVFVIVCKFRLDQVQEADDKLAGFGGYTAQLFVLRVLKPAAHFLSRA